MQEEDHSRAARKLFDWYLVGKDKNHGFQKKENVDFQFYARIQFMREYLLK